MTYATYSFISRMWLYPGDAAWHFITVPSDISEDISHLYADKKRGFGSIRIQCRIGSTSWHTSIFPDSKLKAYLLPIKSEVRKKEGLAINDQVQVHLEIL